MPTQEIDELAQAKTEVYNYCKAMLGDGMVDIELDPKHYETALERALGKYRQRGDSLTTMIFTDGNWQSTNTAWGSTWD